LSEGCDGNSARLNVAAFLENSAIYGPGNRFVIWFQGCSLRCEGCWNKELWPFEDNLLFTPCDILEKIRETKGIEGVTFLGGEPLDQAENLLILAKMLKSDGYSIMLYTGYAEPEISGTVKEDVFSMSDIVVSGRYVEGLRSVYLKWRGSLNQNISFNSDIYRDFEDSIDKRENDVEIHIDETGEITIAGYPEPDDLEAILYGKDSQ
jgi:anaerobic ribonucleoside-triphosphate reductase activating protein